MADKQITIRGVSGELGRRLTELGRARGKSVNATVLEILESAAGISERQTWLRRFMTWTADDVREMDAVIKAQRVVDKKLWK